MMRVCFIAAWVAAAVLASAEPPAASVTSIVRTDPDTGRLVRSIARPNPKNAWVATAEAIDKYVRETAERYQVDPLLVRSVIQVESNNDPFAVSEKGAQGLMQLMPQTARRFSVKNSFNPWENIDGGVRYLKYLLTLFGNQAAPETLALAAYNAGENAVLRHGGVPPYRETTEYVRKVALKWEAARAAERKPPQVEAAAVPQIEQYVDETGVLHIRTRPNP